MNLLCFVGRRFSGKTKSSKIVNEIDPRFQCLSFSDPVKKEYSELADIELEKLYTPKVKDEYRVQLIAYAEHKKETNPYYWAEKLFEFYGHYEYIVIDDLRFVHELKMVVDNKGIVYKVYADPDVRVKRGWKPNPEIDNHYSETEMDLSFETFNVLTGGGGIFNNELESDNKLRMQIEDLLIRHFL